METRLHLVILKFWVGLSLQQSTKMFVFHFSADEITDLLNNFPSTVMYLPKILEAADEAIR